MHRRESSTRVRELPDLAARTSNPEGSNFHERDYLAQCAPGDGNYDDP
jgi:hypothetical protein